MRVVITGATGNVGTSLVRSLAADERVEQVVGVARRRPQWDVPGTTWVEADVATAPLERLFRNADAVVHLAWSIQPSRDERRLEQINVDGSRRVFETAAACSVGTLVHASSVGAYSPGPKDRAVDESWPTNGIPTSFYSRHKSRVERLLDDVEQRSAGTRVVRLRPALIFKREAGSGVRRLFAGPFIPSPLLEPRFVKLIPRVPNLRFQAVHCDDVAEAYRLAVTERRARGAYNVAADPVLDPDVLARDFGALKVPVPARALRVLTDLTWKARLQPTPPGWLDMGLQVPVMDSDRLRSELGWQPRYTSIQALRLLLEGIASSDGVQTPPLDPGAGGPLRSKEILTGVGSRGG